MIGTVRTALLLLTLTSVVKMARLVESKGYRLFEKLGRPRFVSAPMVDQSDLAFRLMVKQNGGDLAYTQMLHARNFCRDKTYQRDCIDWHDYTCKPYGSFVEKESAESVDRNLIVQLAGDDPDILTRAGKLVQGDKNIEAVDLNLGCPQKIAKRGNYGAYLLQDTETVVKLLQTMVNTLDIPVTAKIRRLSTDEETVDLCQRMEKIGISMITLHGRTVEQSKLFTGPCDWGVIKQVKEAVSIPVIANGGVQCRQDALDCLDFTGADAVMSSEGLLENPKMFSIEGDEAFRERFVSAQLNTVGEYLDLVRSYKLPSPLYQVVRSHLFKMLFRFMDAPVNRDLRQRMGNGDMADMDSVLAELNKRFAGIQGTPDEIPELIERGMLGPTLWYYRHRDERAQNRVMSLPKKYPNFQGADAFMSLKVRNNEGSAMLIPEEMDAKEKQRLLKIQLQLRQQQRKEAKAAASRQ